MANPNEDVKINHNCIKNSIRSKILNSPDVNWDKKEIITVIKANRIIKYWFNLIIKAIEITRAKSSWREYPFVIVKNKCFNKKRLEIKIIPGCCFLYGNIQRLMFAVAIMYIEKKEVRIRVWLGTKSW